VDRQKRSLNGLRARFDEIYDARVIGGGFFESNDYYRRDRERYWRSLEFFCSLDIAASARILEIGGGQLALLLNELFGDDCTVGDISDRFAEPIVKQGIPFFTCNLMAEEFSLPRVRYDVVVLLEVIEHLPIPPYVIFERIKKHLLANGGILFLTTPNLFRLRNLIRMISGVEFLDRFQLPRPGHGLGHQLEYSANHLEWQFGEAGMELLMLKHDELGRVGHSAKARLGRALLRPLRLRPIWRDGIVAAARVSQ